MDARGAAPTIRDVARRAGVSIATVSRVLSGSTTASPSRDRVVEAARALGYRPSGVARSLRLRTTSTIGLLVTDIENPYFPEIVRAVEDAAVDRGFSVFLCNSAEDPGRERACFERLIDNRVDGLIVATSVLRQGQVDYLRDAGLPIVLVNCIAGGSGLPGIMSDNRDGGRQATQHLLELGHRRLGHIAGPPGNPAAEERLAGMREALEAAGLDPDAVPSRGGEGRAEAGERATIELVRAHPGITALVCYNDMSAIGALRGLRSCGLHVPGDVSVVGFDDIEAAAWVEPPLTTVEQQKRAMGRWAVDRIGQLLARERGAEAAAGSLLPDSDLVVRLPVRLRIRESTGSAPGVAASRT